MDLVVDSNDAALFGALSVSMWSVSRTEALNNKVRLIVRRAYEVVELVRQAERDRPASRPRPGVVDAQADRGEDARAVLADRLAEPDERLEATAGQAAEEPVDEDLDVFDGEARREDGAGGFL